MASSSNMLLTFNAIKDFVGDLHATFSKPKEVSPLSLYHRLMSLVKDDDAAAQKWFILGFENFFKSHEATVIASTLNDLPDGTIIRYKTGDKIYLDIKNFVSRSDEDTNIIIRQHLLTISTLINPDQSKIAKLEHSQKSNLALAIPRDGSNESEFVHSLLAEAKEAMSGKDFDSPIAGMMSLLHTGVLPKMFNNLQEGVNNGTLDLNKLFSAMSGATGSFFPPPEEGGDTKEADK